ncbi:MAG: hypothetical protein K0V04_26445 [Deltaproteobacteria bacterium]|nr:hypothetical protein [Deltaproteobacteria bacterium]
MSTIKIIAITLSIAAVGSAVVLMTTPKDRPARSKNARAAAPASPSSANPSSSDDEGRELAELRHQVRALAEVSDHANAAVAAEPTPPVEVEPTPTAEVTADDLVDLVDGFDVHLAEQSHDPGATAEASAHIENLLADAQAGRLLSVDCGETLCRSTLEFGDLGQRDARLMEIGSLMPWDADGFFNTDPEDDLRVSVYFSRDGQALPTPGEAS